MLVECSERVFAVGSDKVETVSYEPVFVRAVALPEVARRGEDAVS